MTTNLPAPCPECGHDKSEIGEGGVCLAQVFHKYPPFSIGNCGHRCRDFPAQDSVDVPEPMFDLAAHNRLAIQLQAQQWLDDHSRGLEVSAELKTAHLLIDDLLRIAYRTPVAAPSERDKALRECAEIASKQERFWVERLRNARGDCDEEFYKGKIAGAEFIAAAIRSLIATPAPEEGK